MFLSAQSPFKNLKNHGTSKSSSTRSFQLRLFLTLVCFLLFLALLSDTLSGSSSEGGKSPAVSSIKEWQMDGESLSLPMSLKNLPSRAEVTLTAQLHTNPGDYLYIKTVYAPVQIFADGELIFEYGQPGSFSPFWLDPPTKVALFPLPASGETVSLTMRYQSPCQRSTLTLYPVLIGTSAAILEQLFSEMGFSLFFSIVLIALGMILCLISFVLTRFELSGISFFWLGLFAFCVGIWILGECNLTGLFIQNSTLLYLMAFVGLFILSAPLLKFIQIVLELPHNPWINGMLLTLTICVCAAFSLQLAGIASLSRTLYVFHGMILLFFLLTCALVLSEAVRRRDTAARRLLLPMMILTLFVILELANYYLRYLNSQKSLFFQIGMVLFIISLSVVCGYFMGDILMLRTRNQQLNYEVFLMEKQVDMQKERHRLLSETSTQLRQQRHDLKHHLVVIQTYLNSGETEKLKQYLEELSSSIPKEPLSRICENEAVNAVALHYQAMARQAGVKDCSIFLDIPKDTGKVPEMDLCVIVGNLLENGVTACRNAGHPFIRMYSRCANGVLTITMDNSVSVVTKGLDHTFLSSKPGGGIGLSSIASIAKNYEGGSRFEAENGVFFSSVYLRLH